MIKRRIILMASTFGVLLLAFLVYYFATKEDVDYRRRDLSEGGGAREQIVARPQTGRTIFKEWDKRNRLRRIYRWTKLDKQGNQYDLTDPQVEWYLKSGEVVVITAKRGRIRVNPVGEKWNPREGHLYGDVKVVVDRRAEITEIAPEDRPEDTIRVHTDDVYFDRDDLKIWTAEPVIVYASEAEIYGEGLDISWNESPRELRELRIRRGDLMVIRGGRDRFMASPSMSPDESKGAPTAGGGDGPPGAGETPGDDPTKPGPSGPTSLPGKPKLIPVDSLPAVVKDTYRITLTDRVKLISGDGDRLFVKGIDTLTVDLEFSNPDRDRESEPRKRADRTSATSVPSTGPSEVGPSQPVADTKPTRPEPPPESLVITWAGPLVITPVRVPTKYVQGRFDISAVGKEVQLTERTEVGGKDRKATITCGQLDFRTKVVNGKRVREGELYGPGDQPVTMKMAGGESLTAPEIWLRGEDMHLVGAGEMYRPGGDSPMLASVGASGGDSDNQPVTITWGKQVDVKVGRRKTDRGWQEYLEQATFIEDVLVKQGPTQTMRGDELLVKFAIPVAPEDKVNQISSMLATGNVHLSDSEKDEFIKANTFELTMGTNTVTEVGPDGEVVTREKLYPRRAVATGDAASGYVEARREGSHIENAESLTINFQLEAEEKDEGAPADAEPEKLELSVSTAVLTGKPAKVTRTHEVGESKELKDDVITGKLIRFDSKHETAVITGPGTLEFWTASDVSGNEAKVPRLVSIAWDKELNYRGGAGIADIRGSVKLATAGDVIACETMSVTFEERDEPEVAGGAGDDAKEPKKDDERIGDMRISPRDIATVLAEGKVVLTSTRKDDKGFTERWLELRSESLAHNVKAKEVTCTGPGDLVMAEFRLPGKKNRRNSGEGGLTGGGRPSLSAFSWSEAMTLNWPSRAKKAAAGDKPNGETAEGSPAENFSVRMRGEVILVHLSGKKVEEDQELIQRVRKKLNVKPWKVKDLPSGRKTTLLCDNLYAEFGPPTPTKEGAQSKPEDEGPQVGPLEQLDAWGKVALTDGPRQIVCEQIEYTYKVFAKGGGAGVGHIWGSLPGQPVKNAVVYEQDKALGRLVQTNVGRELVWRRKVDRRGRETNKIEPVKIEGVGGR